MPVARIELTCTEPWMPKQIWINFQAANPEVCERYIPYFVGGRYNATLALHKPDGSPIPCREAKAVLKLAQTQYPGQVS